MIIIALQIITHLFMLGKTLTNFEKSSTIAEAETRARFGRSWGNVSTNNVIVKQAI